MTKYKFMQTLEVLLLFVIIGNIIFFIYSLLDSILYTIPSSVSKIGSIVFQHTYTYLIPLLILILILNYTHKKIVSFGIQSMMTFIDKILNKSTFTTCIFFFLILFFIFVTVTVKIQDKLLYFPKHNERAERILSLNQDYDKLTIDASNDTFSGWGKIDKSKINPTIIYFGGNAENSANTFQYYDLNGWGIFEDYNFIMVDYPGYGLSTGTPTEKTIKSMSLVVYDSIVNLSYIDENQIIVMGFSLGTGFASYISSERDFNKLILLAPYSSMIDIINSRLPIFYGPMTNLIHNKIDTISIVASMNEEKLVFASRKDDVIPYEISQKLIDALDNCIVFIINDKTHNEIITDTSVLEKISEFLINE